MRLSADLVAVLVLVTALVSSAGSREISSFLKICHRNDPNLNECVRRSVDSLRPYLKTGIAELHIPSCEPLHVPRIEINQMSGPISIEAVYTDIEIQGGTNFILKNIKIDVDRNLIKLKLYLPRLEMTSRYNMHGKILMLPVRGNGEACGNFTNIDALVTVQAERYESRKTGKTHLRVTEFYMDFEVGHANVKLNDLFNGDGTLSTALNLFLNNNWKIVLAEIKPVLEETVSELFKTFANKIYAKFPLDTLLPP
ncbi:protein takeout-like [Pseudomyrmex gracilis]|uniref:protein takeout-like n=1 Tax=Pseudomyrmex gracilis TaxID=219809 RepID=UPI000994ABEB|nr:protein takeout-like [Pseudomyrmex gracilis]